MTLNGGGPILLPAKRFNVWSRLYNRFLLEPLPAVGSNAYVAPVIQPVTDADRLLQTLALESSTVSITSAIGFVVATVPSGQRWTVQFMRVRRSSGTWTHNTFLIRSNLDIPMEIRNYTQTATSELWELLKPLELDEGWQLSVNVDTWSVTGNMVTDLLILREDAF